MTGQATDAEIAAFLMALAIIKPDSQEISGAATIMRKHMLPVSHNKETIDIVGTGGDNLKTYNISTASAIVTAACGVTVSKHGNRSVSSRSGAADVLENLGVTLTDNTNTIKAMLDEINLAFLFAPHHHPAMKYVMPVRKALGIPTIFNLLGPLCNPASPTMMLLGVNNPCWLAPMADSLIRIGVRKAWVVCGENHIDEMNICGTTHVVAIDNKTVSRFDITPEDAGLKRHCIASIQCEDSTLYAPMLRRILDGEKNAYYDAVVLNVAAALVIAGLVDDIQQGAQKAHNIIETKQAKQKLNAMIAMSKAR